VVYSAKKGDVNMAKNERVLLAEVKTPEEAQSASRMAVLIGEAMGKPIQALTVYSIYGQVGPAGFVCKTCGNDFSRLTALRSHERSHRGKRK
jgi:hypothetical protein